MKEIAQVLEVPLAWLEFWEYPKVILVAKAERDSKTPSFSPPQVLRAGNPVGEHHTGWSQSSLGGTTLSEEDQEGVWTG